MEKVSKATDGMSGKKIKIGRKYISKRYLGEKAANLFCHVILIGIVFLIIYPFIDKLSTVFLSEADLLDKTVKYIPKEFSLNTLLNTLGVMDYWATLLRTVGFCGAVALIQTFMSTFVAYGFARYKFPLNKLLFGFVLTTLLIPPQVYTTPIYMLFAHKLSLLDTIWPIILLSLICLGFKNALYIFLMRQYFRGLPAEIEEAGMIDGSGHFGIFFRLMFPNAIPMMVTIFLFSFSWQWTDNYYTALFMKNSQLMSMMLSRLLTYGKDALAPVVRSAMLDCGVLLTIIPLVIVYLFGQKFFVQGITRSGIVG